MVADADVLEDLLGEAACHCVWWLFSLLRSIDGCDKCQFILVLSGIIMLVSTCVVSVVALWRCDDA